MTGVQYPIGAGISFFITMSRPTLGPTLSPIQWILEALSMGVKQAEHQADYSPQFNVKVNNVQSLNSTAPYMPYGQGA
jgi:hypothetical protein